MTANTVRAARLERVLKTMADDYHAEWCGKHGGKAARVVCRVDDSGQFDCRFSVWYEAAFIETDEQ